MCSANGIRTSGGEILIRWFRLVLPRSSSLPPGGKVGLSSRQTEARLPSNLLGAAFMKSGCPGATEVVSCSSPTSTLLRPELHVGRPTVNTSPSILARPEMQTFLSSMFRAARFISLPMNFRAKSCPVGRETAVGYISHPIAPEVGKYGRCLLQVGRLYK